MLLGIMIRLISFIERGSDGTHRSKQVAFQSNANHPLAESMGYIKFEGM